MVDLLTEDGARRSVTMRDAITVIRAAFVALENGVSFLFPVTQGRSSDPNTRFGVKPGYDGAADRPGLKVGSYWPLNVNRGLANHGSTTLLLDPVTGFLDAIVSSAFLTALRTAAADAVAADCLARSDAKILAVMGSGHQAYFDALAIAEVRALEHIYVWSRQPDRASKLAARLVEAGLPAQATTHDKALDQADIVSTVTAAREPLIRSVRPGTHISAMGADGPGKCELLDELVASSTLFADDPAQSIKIGEFQSAFNAGLISEKSIASIGAVLTGAHIGRETPDQITIFDSSGIAIQDLALASYALAQARINGLIQRVDMK